MKARITDSTTNRTGTDDHMKASVFSLDNLLTQLLLINYSRTVCSNLCCIVVGVNILLQTKFYTDGDVTIRQHYLCRELKEHNKEEIYIPLVPGQEEEMSTDSVKQKADQLDLVPVLTMCGVVTPTSSCPP